MGKPRFTSSFRASEGLSPPEIPLHFEGGNTGVRGLYRERKLRPNDTLHASLSLLDKNQNKNKHLGNEIELSSLLETEYRVGL